MTIIPSGGPPRVLLVGAYERDNFGDLLFLLITERYLAGTEVIAAAPFAADMRDLVDRRIPAYPALLERERFDAIWTVGGQVGSIDAGRAYRLSASPEELRRFLRSSRRRRRATLADLRLGTAPYIPSPGPRDGHALRIVNSAGVSGIRDVPSPRREQLLDLLRSQDQLGVRDRASSDLLAEHGIGHDLVPDAVHALGILRPREANRDAEVAVIQISQARLADLGHEWVAAQLAHTPALRPLRLRFLLAGAAAGHDSAEAYEDVARRIRRLAPSADVAVLRERRPLAIVDQIQQARVVVASSLHVRIVAATYGVPRVSLARPKVTRYAQTWDAGMPYGVTLDRLDRALTAALLSAGAADAAATALVSRRAHEHLECLAERVRERETRAGSTPARARARPSPGVSAHSGVVGTTPTGCL